jgi:hypothetical protein
MFMVPYMLVTYISIKGPTRCTFYVYSIFNFFSLSSTRFGCHLHPSSGAKLQRTAIGVCMHGFGMSVQRFSNFFQVRTTFISQNVLRTTLLLSHLKANCLRFSTMVCNAQFMLIQFFWD